MTVGKFTETELACMKKRFHNVYCDHISWFQLYINVPLPGTSQLNIPGIMTNITKDNDIHGNDRYLT